MEAAQALGMSRCKAMRRVVLPQAMRVIVRPTGNETIAMLKDTSLLIAIPVATELFFQLQAIGARTFESSPGPGRGNAVLPDRLQRADGRPVLSGEAVRTRLRRPSGPQTRPRRPRAWRSGRPSEHHHRERPSGPRGQCDQILRPPTRSSKAST